MAGEMLFHLPAMEDPQAAACGASDGAFVFRWSKSDCPACLSIRKPNAVAIELGGRGYWQHAVLCGECGMPMSLRLGTSRFANASPVYYSCTAFPACRATHQALEDGAPDGAPVNAATKAARKSAREFFEQWWPDTGCSGQDAWRWMRAKTGLPQDGATFARLDLQACNDLILDIRAAQRDGFTPGDGPGPLSESQAFDTFIHGLRTREAAPRRSFSGSMPAPDIRTDYTGVPVPAHSGYPGGADAARSDNRDSDELDLFNDPNKD